ncbi:MAG: DnaA regulatory inactivator Hda [Gammaproteobacteria bacterium]
MFTQLPLGISLPDNVTLASFIAGENEALLITLQDFCVGKGTEQNLYLWGQSGVGKTHLLQAACHVAAEAGLATTYIPLRQATQFMPTLLQDLHTLQLICIDDVQSVAGQAEWEQGLFALYQLALETKAHILWSADAPPPRLAIKLKDLQSRLAASLVLEVQPLTDAEKLIALQQRAHSRGLELPDNVGNYLLTHCTRHMGDLLANLDKLDRAALIAQRALTVPFVKQVLGI